VAIKTTFLIVGAVILCLWYVQPVCSQETRPTVDKDTGRLVGRWAIAQTKEPGKPYLDSYKGRPFVAQGPNAFCLIMEYRNDGTFRRISRVGASETVQEGSWKLSGHELRQKHKDSPGDEVIYVRFDSPDQFTIIEVHEDMSDPGLFARFKKIQ
jgi:hypothetical protein